MTARGSQIEKQEIRFCSAPDGVNIAYAALGEGPPLVKAPNWITHLEREWQFPLNRNWLSELTRDHRLIRYDQRGVGLSDWAVEDVSLDAWVRDMEAVTDALDLEQFPILGISQGGQQAVEYAARHPDRVTQLILMGSYARGVNHRDRSPSEREEAKALLTLTREGWGRDDPSYRNIWANRIIPDAPAEQKASFNEFQRVATSPENAVQFLVADAESDIRDRLADVECPALVLHAREDPLVPFEEGRRLASGLPDSHFVPLESQNHIPIESEPAWDDLWTEVRRFLGVTPEGPSPSEDRMPASKRVAPDAEETDEAGEARDLLASMDHLPSDHYTVVGEYQRFEEETRQNLLDVCHQLQAALKDAEPSRENYLIWGSRGSGKTYLVQQIAEELSAVEYTEINLAETGREEMAETLQSLEDAEGPGLFLVDEVDAQATEDWPYETLQPWLDINVEQGKRVVFTLAGSSGTSLEELKERMASRPKGTDLLSCIPPTNEVLIPPLSVGDRMLIAASHLISVAQANDRALEGVEKIALYYVALSPELRNAEQLREFAVQTANRLPPGEARVKYDHLFEPGDAENKRFWMEAMPEAEDLANSFITLEG